MDYPETRYERNPDGSYTVIFGTIKVHAKDQIEAGRILSDLISDFVGEGE